MIPSSSAAEIWSVWGTWISAFGSISAAAVALGIALHSDKVRRTERNDELAIQARLVHASVVKAQPTFQITVHNFSSEPITGVRVVGLCLHDDADVVLDDSSWTAAGLSWPRIEPGTEVKTMAIINHNDEPVMLVDRGWRVSVDLEFVDARALRWRRWANVPPRRSPVKVVVRDPPARPPVEGDG